MEAIPQQSPEVEAVRAQLIKKFVGSTKLTAVELKELDHMSRGFRSKTSAEILNVTDETIRKRRKFIYRKLGIGGHQDFLQSLLALAMEGLR